MNSDVVIVSGVALFMLVLAFVFGAMFTAGNYDERIAKFFDDERRR